MNKQDNKTDINIFDNKDIFIFDFDGVLVDSVEIKTKAFAELYKKYGSEVEEQVIAHHKLNGGMSRYEKFKYYHAKFIGIVADKNMITELSDSFSSFVMEKIIVSKEVEGVTEILTKAESRGIVCSIASAAPEEEVNEIIRQRGWSKFFGLVLGSPTSKAKNITKILNAYNCLPSNAIFFGDSNNDLQAARECNIDFVPINFLGSDKTGFRDLINRTDVF